MFVYFLRDVWQRTSSESAHAMAKLWLRYPVWHPVCARCEPTVTRGSILVQVTVWSRRSGAACTTWSWRRRRRWRRSGRSASSASPTTRASTLSSPRSPASRAATRPRRRKPGACMRNLAKTQKSGQCPICHCFQWPARGLQMVIVFQQHPLWTFFFLAELLFSKMWLCLDEKGIHEWQFVEFYKGNKIIVWIIPVK